MHTHPIQSFVLFHICAIFKKQLATAKMPSKSGTDMREKISFIASVVISICIVPLPCNINYSHQFLTVPLFFMHVCQILYNMPNAYMGCYMNIQEPNHVKTSVTNSDIGKRHHYQGWAGGAHVLYIYGCSSSSLWMMPG